MASARSLTGVVADPDNVRELANSLVEPAIRDGLASFVAGDAGIPAKGSGGNRRRNLVADVGGREEVGSPFRPPLRSGSSGFSTKYNKNKKSQGLKDARTGPEEPRARITFRSRPPPRQRRTLGRPSLGRSKSRAGRGRRSRPRHSVNPKGLTGAPSGRHAQRTELVARGVRVLHRVQNDRLRKSLPAFAVWRYNCNMA